MSWAALILPSGGPTMELLTYARLRMIYRDGTSRSFNHKEILRGTHSYTRHLSHVWGGRLHSLTDISHKSVGQAIQACRGSIFLPKSQHQTRVSNLLVLVSGA